jgi:dienelactone hydrolase
MKLHLYAVCLTASLALYSARAAIGDAPASAATPAPVDQPSALQGEAIPAPGQPARGGRGGRGGGAVANAVQLTDDQLAQLHAKLDELNAAIKALKDAKADDDLIVDAESCGWIVETTLRIPNSYGDSDSPTSPYSKCLSSLNAGLRRAQQIKDGTAAWPQLTGSVKRAYRSVVDGTAQPYELTIPASYDPAKPIALYVYLHGMSHYVPDLGWDWTGGNDQPGGRGSNNNYISMNVFGRGNNSFRWAGETDVFEAIASVRKRYNIDPDRIVLAGFSMGGAGSWQIGLHSPDLFCGLEIDAGVIGNRLNMDNLTPAQKAATATYGIMIPHAVNVVDVPLVAYAGENDAQLAASKSISAQLVRDGYHMQSVSPLYSVGTDIFTAWLAAPGQGHSHATHDNVQDTLGIINNFTNANFVRGRVIPDHIRFVTYTLRYNHDFWLTVDGLQQQFDHAEVDATRDAAKANYTITTQNISRLILDDIAQAKQITIDGDTLPAPNLGITETSIDRGYNAPQRVLLVRNSAGHWQEGSLAADTGLRKQHDLQGPVNDAFFDSFLCVTPTGKPYNAIADERGKQELTRFSAAFTRDYCGLARTKADTDITAADIANSNLVLFGDPGSNKILAKIAGQLPIKWTKDSIIVGDQTYSAADHVPVLIYPNPLNPKRYIVLNTGLVAGGGGGGNNVQGYGDYVILQVTQDANGRITDKVAQDGVFDESWKLPAKM